MTTALRPPTAAVLAAIIRDTVNEARARWLFWGLFGVPQTHFRIVFIDTKLDEKGFQLLLLSRTHVI